MWIKWCNQIFGISIRTKVTAENMSPCDAKTQKKAIGLKGSNFSFNFQLFFSFFSSWYGSFLKFLSKSVSEGEMARVICHGITLGSNSSSLHHHQLNFCTLKYLKMKCCRFFLVFYRFFNKKEKLRGSWPKMKFKGEVGQLSGELNPHDTLSYSVPSKIIRPKGNIPVSRVWHTRSIM